MPHGITGLERVDGQTYMNSTLQYTLQKGIEILRNDANKFSKLFNVNHTQYFLTPFWDTMLEFIKYCTCVSEGKFCLLAI